MTERLSSCPKIRIATNESNIMSKPESLPRDVEGLTAQWLNDALRQQSPGIKVKSMNIDHILWGTATKVLVDVQYEEGSNHGGIPNKLCIKGELDERSRQALAGMTTTGTQIEAVFFNDLGPRLGIPLPRHWYGGSEPGMGLLVLDNLTVQGYRFGAPTEAWSPDRVANALDILAILHGSTWDKKFPELSWLTLGSTGVRQAAEMLMSDQHWQGHFVKPEVYKLPKALADNQRIIQGYRAIWRHDDANARCVIHGDAHLGNTCINPSEQPFFIDWAGPSYSHWGIDVPYFMVGALSLDDRRAVEKDLFEHYLGRLAAHGGPRLDRGEAWDDYRRHVVHGMMWATLPPQLQALENVFAMGERYAAAMMEHDTLNRLGV